MAKGMGVKEGEFIILTVYSFIKIICGTSNTK